MRLYWLNNYKQNKFLVKNYCAWNRKETYRANNSTIHIFQDMGRINRSLLIIIFAKFTKRFSGLNAGFILVIRLHRFWKYTTARVALKRLWWHCTWVLRQAYVGRWATIWWQCCHTIILEPRAHKIGHFFPTSILKS